MDYEKRILYSGIAEEASGRFVRYAKDDQDGGTPIQVTMFIREHRTSFVVSRKVKGISKSGKPWSRWQDMTRLFLSVKETKKSGLSLNVYGTYRIGPRWSMFQNVTSSEHLVMEIVGRDFIDEVNEEAYRLALLTWEKNPYSAYRRPGSKSGSEGHENQMLRHSYIRDAVYPMLRTRKVSRESDLMAGKSFGARSATEMEYTIELFGKRNYRKDLVKAVAKNEVLDNIFFARAFRNLVPSDWLVTFLNHPAQNEQPLELTKRHLTNLRDMLPKLSLKQRRRLLFGTFYTPIARTSPDEIRRYTYEIWDALASANRVPDEFFATAEFTSWKELHDDIDAEVKRQRYGNTPIPETPLAKKIKEIPVDDGFGIILPVDTDMLRKWGRDMRHCIGTYAKEAVAGRHVFVGIVKDGRMIGNAQLDSKEKRCVQILGYRNERLERQDIKRISSLLSHHDVMPQDAFMGAAGVR